MKKTGIITALTPEAACLTAADIFPDSPIEVIPGMLLILSGMGQKRAKHAAKQLIKAGVGKLISFGTAGGLHPELKSGDLCIPEKVITDNSLELQTEPDWHSNMLKLLHDIPGTVHTAPLFSSEKIVSSNEEKASINKQTQAVVIDMESAAILLTAKQHQVPCLVLRAIVDTVEMQIPDSVLKHTDHFGNAKLLPLLYGLFTHPSQLPLLIKLASRFKMATTTLKWVAKKLD